MDDKAILNDLRDRVYLKLRAISDGVSGKYVANHDPLTNRYVYFTDITATNPGYTLTAIANTTGESGVGGRQSIKVTIKSDTVEVTLTFEVDSNVFKATFGTLPSVPVLFEFYRAVEELEAIYGVSTFAYPAGVVVLAK